MNVQIPVCFKSIGKKLGKGCLQVYVEFGFRKSIQEFLTKYILLIHILQDDWREHIKIFKINIKLIENDSVTAFAKCSQH